MAFKLNILLALLLGLMVGCGPQDQDAREDEDIIGDKVEATTDLQLTESETLGVLAIFDETLRKIHQFDLQNMIHLRTLEVQNPGQEHFLLHDPNGKYTVDMTYKHLSIFQESGQVQHNPVKFFGEPVSTSFRPDATDDLGYMVLYDDLKNVSILELTPSGVVSRSLVLGPIVGGDVGIQSGDVSGGYLILGMSDGTLRKVDLSATLIGKAWVYETFDSGLTSIKWVAPSPSNPNQVMIRSAQAISVYDFSTSSIVSQITTEKYFKIYKYSKYKDPHIILSESSKASGLRYDDSVLSWSSKSDEDSYGIVYLSGSELKRRLLTKGEESIMFSELDLDNDTWSTVLSKKLSQKTYNNVNGVRETRRFVKSAYSHGGALAEITIPDNTLVKMSQNYIFALFPLKLGYAQRIDVNTSDIKDLKYFNLKHIQK